MKDNDSKLLSEAYTKINENIKPTHILIRTLYGINAVEGDKSLTDLFTSDEIFEYAKKGTKGIYDEDGLFIDVNGDEFYPLPHYVERI